MDGDIANLDQVPVYFVCYSRKQRMLVEQIEAKLGARCKRGELSLWRDVTNLDVWEAFTPVILDAVRRAAGAIVVFSDDWGVSDYIQTREWPAISSRKAEEPSFKIFPLAYNALTKDNPLGQQNFINPRPLKGSRSGLRDAALTRLSELVGEHASALRPRLSASLRSAAEPHSAPAPDSAVASPGVADSLPAGGSPVLDGVPELPESFVEPAELAVLSAQIAGGRLTAISGLQGEGGTGKSVLAAAIARRTAHVFVNEVYWITVGEQATSEDVRRMQSDLLSRLGVTVDRAPSGLSKGTALLADALMHRAALVIVDDVWHPWQARAFDIARAGGEARVLFTTRFAEVLPAGSTSTQMTRLSRSDAEAFLQRLTHGIPCEEDDLPAVLDASGGLRLALAVFVATAKAEGSWESVVSRLDGLAVRFGHGDDASSAQKSLFVALSTLDADDQRLALYLSAFPADTLIPVDLLAQLWRIAPEEADALIGRLAAKELVSAAEGHVGIHDHVHDFLVLEAEVPSSEIHLMLWELAVAKARDGWGVLAEDCPYLWERMVWHGCRAGLNSKALREFASDIEWLAERIRLQGASAAEQDVGLICDVTAVQDMEPLSRFRRVLRHGGLFEAASLGPGLSASLECWLGAIGLTGRVGRRFRCGSLPVPSPGLVQTLRGHSSETWGAAFFRDGRRLATCGEDGTARIWDLRNGQTLHTLVGHTGQVWRLALSRDDRRLATAGADGTVRVWDTTTGAAIRTAATVAGEAWGVAFSDDRRRLALCSDDGVVHICDSDGDGLPLTFDGHAGPLWDIALSPDGRHLVTAGGLGVANIWDIDEREVATSLSGHPKAVRAVAYSPDGRRVATGSDDPTVRVWDAHSGEAVILMAGHCNAVWAVSFSPDGSRIATGSDDGSARIWNADTGAPLATLRGHSNPVHGLAIAADGRRLATVSGDGTARIWDIQRAERQDVAEPTSFGEVHDLAFSADGARLLTAVGDGTARVWDTQSGECVLTLSGHAGPVWGIGWGPDELTIASASEDHTVRIWDAGTGTPLRTLRGHTAQIWDVAYSPDGRYLATASDDNTARVWEPHTGEALFTFEGHEGRVWEVAFSQDGHRLATAGDDGTAVILDVRSGEAIKTVGGHGGSVWDLAFSSDGLWLATASEDGDGRLWDVHTGQLVRAFSGHTAQVWGIAFSPDDRYLVTGSGDGTARVWDCRNGTCVLTLALACSGPLAWHGDVLAAAAGAHWAIVDISGIL